MMKSLVWRNGRFIEWEKATVHVLSHALSRGSAIFDVLMVHHGVDGPAAFRLGEHLDRLYYSAKLLGMRVGFAKDVLVQAVLETARRNSLSQGHAKIMAYWSEETMLKLVPEADLDVDIFAIPDPPAPPARELPPSKACISNWCKIPPDSIPVKAKACAHYLNGMLSHADAQSRGFDMGILLDANGFVAESAIKTLFMVRDGVLITPGQGWILKSITRQTILEIANDEGIIVDECAIRPTDIQGMDECFAASTSYMVQPIGQIDDHLFPGTPGPVSTRLAQLCQQAATGKIDRYRKWLTPV